MKQDAAIETFTPESEKRIQIVGVLFSVLVVAFSVWLLWNVVSVRKFSVGFSDLFLAFLWAFLGTYAIAAVFSILLALGSPLRISAKNMVFEHGRIFVVTTLLTYVPIRFFISSEAAFAIAACAYPVFYGMLLPAVLKSSDLVVPIELVNSGAGRYFIHDFGEIHWHNYPQTTNVTIVVSFLSVFLFSMIGESVWQAGFAVASSTVLTFFLKDSYVLRRYTLALGFLSVSVSAWWLFGPI